MDCKPNDIHGENIIQKINNYFGNMNSNQRPLQIACAGGEGTLHPDFIECLKAFYDLGITPNYTTNGMWSFDEEKTKKIIKATKKYCGGVAISCHEHLDKYWRQSANLFIENNIKLNFHIIISDEESSNKFREIYNEFSEVVDYFVLLPYGAIGRAEPKEIDWEYMVSVMPEDTSKIAFGANFYPYLIKNKGLFDVSLYSPESMSKFICLVEDRIYPSSFHPKHESEKIIFEGN